MVYLSVRYTHGDLIPLHSVNANQGSPQLWISSLHSDVIKQVYTAEDLICYTVLLSVKQTKISLA